MTAGEMAAHFENDGRQCEHEADPEAGRVMSASSGLGGASRLATSGSSAMPQIGQLPGPTWRSLGMHRAGVDRAFRHRALLRPAVFLEISDGIGGEFGAGSRPEQKWKVLAAVVESAACLVAGFHGHAADGIAQGRSGVGVMIVMAVTGVIEAGLAAAAAAGPL